MLDGLDREPDWVAGEVIAEENPNPAESLAYWSAMCTRVRAPGCVRINAGVLSVSPSLWCAIRYRCQRQCTVEVGVPSLSRIDAREMGNRLDAAEAFWNISARIYTNQPRIRTQPRTR